ncbi:HAD family hydrolase [Entomospira culicis]|uniref:HAD family hydrolase n=1 Tax=Entomospira culicis TaxID=2719989 RepID=A0A968GDR4_9SPIO|nr:HAD family hydrolase [Entomospira culicis]NIZ18457.1 HAD family hydrolase [Entomospira culicis]NIZ68673.1 HAD family hydrolase [Entomospira culicis]WDI37272.1 HAD family hydrolase [Entomospira culicis]WDI38901.1 HAD family hydrolase [Entomospira culicis]
MKIKAVIFDVDGTVYPNTLMHIMSIPLFIRYGRRLLRLNKARHYLHAHPDEVAKAGVDFLEFQGQLMSQYSHGRYDTATSRRQIEEFRTRWEQIFHKIKPYKHCKESVLALKEAGLKVALFSDFPINPKVGYLGLDGIWDGELCSEDAGALKPDPRGFLAIAQQLNVRPEEVLFVGNSHKYDVEGAKSAGMYTAHLKWGKPVKNSLADITFYGYKSFADLVLNWIASL